MTAPLMGARGAVRPSPTPVPWRERVARWMEAWTLRGLGRIDEALSMQLQLESEFERAGQVDVYVFQELEALYRARGDEARVTHYASLRNRAAGR